MPLHVTPAPPFSALTAVATANNVLEVLLNEYTFIFETSKLDREKQSTTPPRLDRKTTLFFDTLKTIRPGSLQKVFF